MSYKTILVAASGGGASNGAVELACVLGKRFGSHVEGLHVKVDVETVIASTAGTFGMPLDGQWIDKLTRDADELAATTRKSFDAIAARHGLVPYDRQSGAVPTTGWREAAGYAPRIVSREAMFNDLVVLGRSDRVIDAPHSDTIEETLVRSGRPVLLAPARLPEPFGDNIVVGWNDSAEAVRALAAAVPLLAAASRVTVVTLEDRSLNRAAGAIDYLAWQGVAAKHVHRGMTPHVGPGEQLLAAARDEGADLLVMGAYGHSPWREGVFGGATRDIVGVSLLPLLLAH